jgi:LmbE family N-acetylglucosaminyl deacetylase
MLKLHLSFAGVGIATLACTALAAGIWAADDSRPSAIALANLDPNAMPIDLDRGAAGLTRCLMQLRTRASMLMITAHPDDEDGGMLAYESRHVGARTMLLTLTRGEGGQNAMSTDFYDALGLVRTQELLQAGRFYGVQQFWGTVIDYGFSKTREEALEKWGPERVLSDTVRVVRMTRPLVITAVFVGAPTDGHGNHQVSGEMAQEVFNAAGDPDRFPEQIRAGLRPWKPLKVYARVPFFAPTKDKKIYDYATDQYLPIRFRDYANNTWITETPATNLSVPEGTQIPATGLTALQIGRQGWGFQKSQNGGNTLPPPALYSAPYHRYGSRVEAKEHEQSFYDGIDVSLNGIASLSTGGDSALLSGPLKDLSNCVAQAIEQYRPDKPAVIAPPLATGLKLARDLLEKVRASSLSDPGKSDIEFELQKKAEQFEKALTLALGISFQATVVPDKEPGGTFAAFASSATFTIATPGQHLTVQTHLLNSGPEILRVRSIMVAPSDGKGWQISGGISAPADLAGQKELKQKFQVAVPEDAAAVRPYFQRPDEEQPYYNLTDERFRNLSFAPYPLFASARIEFQDVAWDLRQIVQTASRVDNIGNELNPLLIEPAISVSVSPGAGAVPLASKTFSFTCTLHSNVKGPAKGVLRLTLPAGWQSDPEEYPFAFTRDGDGGTVSFKITPGSIGPERYEIRAVADYDKKHYAEGYRLVGYPGLRPYPYFRPATYKATGVDVKTAPGLRVAFFPGTGDDVPQALDDLGLHSTTLSGEVLANGDLSGFDAIILGVRAYDVRPELRAFNGRLLDYVKRGGVLIVQYNVQNFDDEYGPYPFSLGSNPPKVVDENSAVQILAPASPVLNWPNKITEADFKGWQEERGHGFMDKFGAPYQALFEMHDPGQPPQRGGMLIARYGKGLYVYDALALYRQLPAGVPGAYRIVANLVSAGKNPGRNQTGPNNESKSE